MQRSAVALAIAALLLTAVPPGATALKSSAAAAAQAEALEWLRAHRNSPQGDDLAELKDQNPEAYALVKALLTKRSLGLLDPRHPTASFAAPPPAAAQDAAAPQGAAAFEKIAEESGEPQKVAPMYAEAPAAPVHHDWLGWKPQQSAMDDEAMVKSVLGAVAELKGGKVGALRGSGSANDEAPAAPADALSWTDSSAAISAPALVAPTAPVAPTMPAAAAVTALAPENNYLKAVDFGFGARAAPPQAPEQENSYLKNIDLAASLTPAAPAATAVAPLGTVAAKPRVGLSSVKQDSTNYLSGFSWDDNAPAASSGSSQNTQAAPAQQEDASSAATVASSPKARPANPKANAFYSWLNGAKPAPKKAARAPTQAPAQNSYMMDLA